MKSGKSNSNRSTQRTLIITVIEDSLKETPLKKIPKQDFGKYCRDLLKKESNTNKKILLKKVCDSPWNINL